MADKFELHPNIVPIIRAQSGALGLVVNFKIDIMSYSSTYMYTGEVPSAGDRMTIRRGESHC
jgi:hypothetical protein